MPIFVLVLILIGLWVNVVGTSYVLIFVGAFMFGTFIGYSSGYDSGIAERRKTQRQQSGPTIDELLRRAEEQLRQAEEAQRQQRAARPRPRKPSVPAHWKVLGLKPGASMAQINTRYHELALKAHPDRPGGSVRAMQALNIARDLARREALAKV